jgi:hypothetical protein
MQVGALFERAPVASGHAQDTPGHGSSQSSCEVPRVLRYTGEPAVLPPPTSSVGFIGSVS